MIGPLAVEGRGSQILVLSATVICVRIKRVNDHIVYRYQVKGWHFHEVRMVISALIYDKADKYVIFLLYYYFFDQIT